MEDNSLRHIKTLASEIIEFSQTCGVQFGEETEAIVAELHRMIESQYFNVMVLGTFSRGKSTFLNALIGRRLLYESPKEATGSITTICNSDKNSICVQISGKEDEVFPVDDESYNRIKYFVDVDNSNSSKTQLLIDYPMNGFDEDITFMDTPGLSGLGEEQLKVTREAMSEADAVIMIVSYKSLEKDEMDLILGKNCEFGKIRPQNLIIVINKIGLLLKGVPPELEEEKIAQSRNEILEQLHNNGADKIFKDIKVFAVDSLYYLQSVDDNAYSEVVQNDETPSREEMRRISRFDELRTGLMRLLETSARAEITRKKLLDTMDGLCKIMDDHINKLVEDEESCRRQLREELTQKLEGACKAKRKVLAKISLYILEQINALNERLGKYKEDQLDKINEKCAEYIFNKITNMDNLNTETYQILTNYAGRMTTEFSQSLQDKIAEFFRAFKDQLSVHTENCFNKEFGTGILHAERINVGDISIKNAKVSSEGLTDEEQQIDKELFQKREELKQATDNVKKLKEKRDAINEEVERSSQNIESDYRAKKRILGPRPEPKEIVTRETVKVKVFLFFTKNEIREKKDLDYSNVKAYDEQMRALTEGYHKQLNELDNKRCSIVEIQYDIDSEERRIRQLPIEISGLEEQKRMAEKSKRERLKRENEKMLDRCKAELTFKMSQAVEKSVNAIFDSAISENDRIRNEMTRQSDEYVEIGVEEFKTKADIKLKELSSGGCDDYAAVSKKLAVLLDRIKQKEN